jgi:hypothetical protein
VRKKNERGRQFLKRFRSWKVGWLRESWFLHGGRAGDRRRDDELVFGLDFVFSKSPERARQLTPEDLVTDDTTISPDDSLEAVEVSHTSDPPVSETPVTDALEVSAAIHDLADEAAADTMAEAVIEAADIEAEADLVAAAILEEAADEAEALIELGEVESAEAVLDRARRTRSRWSRSARRCRRGVVDAVIESAVMEETAEDRRGSSPSGWTGTEL